MAALFDALASLRDLLSERAGDVDDPFPGRARRDALTLASVLRPRMAVRMTRWEREAPACLHIVLGRGEHSARFLIDPVESLTGTLGDENDAVVVRWLASNARLIRTFWGGLQVGEDWSHVVQEKTV